MKFPFYLTLPCFLDCKCNIVGASSKQCNMAGHCTCKDLFYGQKCRKCIHGYYFNLTEAKCIGEKLLLRL